MELKQLNNLLPNLPTFKHEDTFGVIKVATRTSEWNASTAKFFKILRPFKLRDHQPALSGPRDDGQGDAAVQGLIDFKTVGQIVQSWVAEPSVDASVEHGDITIAMKWN